GGSEGSSASPDGGRPRARESPPVALTSHSPTRAQDHRTTSMKAGIDKILKRTQAEYLDTLLPPRDALLARMEEYAAEHDHPIADAEVAQLERLMVRARRPQRIIEVGTDILAVAKKFVAEAQLPCRVKFHQGRALEVLTNLDGADFVFIDCVKTEYEQY